MAGSMTQATDGLPARWLVWRREGAAAEAVELAPRDLDRLELNPLIPGPLFDFDSRRAGARRPGYRATNQLPSARTGFWGWTRKGGTRGHSLITRAPSRGAALAAFRLACADRGLRP